VKRKKEATMPTTNHSSKLLRRTLLAAIAGAMVLTAGAQPAAAEEVSPTGKGIVGGSLLGAEVVTIVESFIGVRQGWAYGVGAGVGAIGGGIGGYFVEQGSSDGRVPVYMLAGGLALIIPALVLSLNATRYMPDETATQDTGAPDLPPADPGKPGGSAVTPPANTVPPMPPTTPSPSPVPPPPNPSNPPPQGAPSVPDALFHLNVDIDPKKHASFRVGVPVPNVKPMWSQSEVKQYGMVQGTEMRLSVVKLTF
jgi:hypothetical protein